MREIRLHGSEGGGTELNRSFLPLSKLGWSPFPLSREPRSRSQEGPEFCSHLAENIGRHKPGILRGTSPPIGAPEMVAEHDAGNGEAIRQRDFEGILYHVTCDRADDAQSCRSIVGPG